MFDTPIRAGNRSRPGRSKLTNPLEPPVYCQVAPSHGACWPRPLGMEGLGKARVSRKIHDVKSKSWELEKMIEASLVFTLVFHEHQALLEVKSLCLFLKFPATRQLEGLVPKVRKVLTLSLAMSSCCFNHLEKENRKTLLSDPPTGLQRSWAPWDVMRWQRRAEGPQRHIYWGKGHLEIQAHCREQIRGIIGAEIPSGFISSSPWTNALYTIFCEVTCFFWEMIAVGIDWQGMELAHRNHRTTSFHLKQMQWPNSHTPNPHSPLHSWFLTNRLNTPNPPEVGTLHTFLPVASRKKVVACSDFATFS